MVVLLLGLGIFCCIFGEVIDLCVLCFFMEYFDGLFIIRSMRLHFIGILFYVINLSKNTSLTDNTHSSYTSQYPQAPD